MEPSTSRRAVAVGALVAIPLAAAIFQVASQAWVAPPLAVLILVAHFGWRQRTAATTALAVAVALAVALAYGAVLVSTTIANMVDPPQWDFRAFWVMSRVAALHLNFYEPEHARLLAGAFQNTPDFLPELDFPYPPPTMLLFAPLGWLDINDASRVWGTLQLIILALDIWLIWRLFQRDRGLLGALLVASLVLLLRPTQLTVEFAQTNFLVLFFVLLLWRDIGRPRAGLWLALGTWVKPLTAILGLFIVVRRRWAALAVGVVTALVLLAMTVAAYGLQPIRTYLVVNPVSSAPSWVYTQTINQSLLAMIVRATGGGPAGVSPFMNPLFVVAATAIVGTAGFITAYGAVISDELALSLLIPTALMLYPSSSTHYGVLLLVPLFYLISRQGSLPGGLLLVIAVAVTTYALAGGSRSFLADAGVWLVLAGLAAASIVEHVRLKRQRAHGLLSASELDLRRLTLLARYR